MLVGRFVPYGLVGVAALAACARQPTLGCAQVEWTTPIAFGAPRAIGGTLGSLTGVPIPAYLGVRLPAALDAPLVPNESLLVIVRGGTLIHGPRGRFVFRNPVAVSARDSSIVVLWGEDAKPPATSNDWFNVVADQIWTASWHPETGWSPPLKLLDIGRRLTWPPDHGLDVAVDAAGGVHVVVVGAMNAITYIRRAHGSWRTSSMPAPLGPVYASIAAASPDTVAIAWVSADDSVRNGGANTLFVARSTNGGESFEKARRVQRFGARPAYAPRLMALPHGRVLLLWRQETRSNDEQEALRIAASPDGGLTWGAVSDAPYPSGASDPVVAADGQGMVHVVFSRDAMPLSYMCWNGGWSRSESLLPNWVTHGATVAIGAKGTLLVAFTGRRSSDSLATAYLIEAQPPR